MILTYDFTPHDKPECATVTVAPIENIEQAEGKHIDLFFLLVDLQAHHIKHVFVTGSTEGTNVGLNDVDQVLYDLGFDCVNSPDDFR